MLYNLKHTIFNEYVLNTHLFNLGLRVVENSQCKSNFEFRISYSCKMDLSFNIVVDDF